MHGTLLDNQLHPAPRAFMLHGAMVTNPKAEHFAALNAERATYGLPPYLPVRDKRPSTDAAHYAVATGWELHEPYDIEDERCWLRVYEVREVPPPPPRTFVTADVVEQLMLKGVYAQVRAWLEQQGYLDMVLATKDFSEADQNFKDMRDALKTLVGWTDEQVEAVLVASAI